MSYSLNQTVQDLYLLYLVEFNNPQKISLFKGIIQRVGNIEIALLNATTGFLVSDELIEFLKCYMKKN